MAHTREYSEDTAANLLRSVRQQEHQYQQLTKELEEERKNVALQLQRCNYNSETASVCSGSSADSFVWRGQGPGSVASEEDFTDDESRMSGSALVDSCLKVLQERGLTDSRDDQDPLYSRKNKMEPQEVTGQSNSLVSQDWERELMDADLSSGRGQTVKKVVTRTEVRTVRTIDGRVVQDEYDPGTEHTEIERFSYGAKALNGEGPGTPTKRYAPGDEYRNGQRGPGSTSSVEDYRSPKRGPAGSQSSVDDYRSPRGYPPRGGYSSADEGRMTPNKYGDTTGYMSDSYTINKVPRAPSTGPAKNEPQYVRTAVQTTSMSLPRSHGQPSGPRGPGTATMPRTSSAGRPTSKRNEKKMRIKNEKCKNNKIEMFETFLQRKHKKKNPFREVIEGDKMCGD
ncbi:Catenin delta-2 [Exaiptasia diaphana]|nr:Catenin delta-2 [Exaiptasia diaphana]